ncbi:MAG: hypothetical protein C0456_12260, partial [Hyphomonas sp.]|nr:hypothetical protein [Hyphomonas sp.]
MPALSFDFAQDELRYDALKKLILSEVEGWRARAGFPQQVWPDAARAGRGFGLNLVFWEWLGGVGGGREGAGPLR